MTTKTTKSKTKTKPKLRLSKRERRMAAKPPYYGLTEVVREAIKVLYVNEEKSVRESVRLARLRSGEKIDEALAGKFIRYHGWTRSQSYYAKRSTFAGHNKACFEEAKAKREGRI